MSRRDPVTPWLRGTAAPARPLADGLRRTATTAAPGAWLQRGAVGEGGAAGESGPATGACARCGELHAAQLAAVAADRARGLADLEVLRARMTAALAALDVARQARAEALTQTIVDVALSVCAELAPAVAAIDAGGLLAVVRSALGMAGSPDAVLQLRTDDAAVLGGQLPPGITCQINDDLAPGEVWVEAPRLVVDGRWATRLAALREPLLALVRVVEPTLAPTTVALTDEVADEG